MANNQSSDQSDTNNHQSSEQTSYDGRVDEKCIETWDIENLPNISGWSKTKIYETINEAFGKQSSEQTMLTKCYNVDEKSQILKKFKQLLQRLADQIQQDVKEIKGEMKKAQTENGYNI